MYADDWRVNVDWARDAVPSEMSNGTRGDRGVCVCCLARSSQVVRLDRALNTGSLVLFGRLWFLMGLASACWQLASGVKINEEQQQQQ